MNLWFQGGGYACIWSFGFATELKRLGIKTNLVGGYSSGAVNAAYLCNTDSSCESRATWSMIRPTTSPFKKTFGIFSSRDNVIPMVEDVAIGHPSFFNPSHYNGKLWVPIREVKSLTGTWRNSWRDYDDLSETLQATSCIPIFFKKLVTCHYDDSGPRRGPTIDGGFFSLNPPKCWDKKETLVVSPWGNGDINMKPAAKLTDLAFPKYENIKIHFNLGISHCREYFS